MIGCEIRRAGVDRRSLAFWSDTNTAREDEGGRNRVLVARLGDLLEDVADHQVGFFLGCADAAHCRAALLQHHPLHVVRRLRLPHGHVIQVRFQKVLELPVQLGINGQC